MVSVAHHQKAPPHSPRVGVQPLGQVKEDLLWPELGLVGSALLLAAGGEHYPTQNAKVENSCSVGRYCNCPIFQIRKLRFRRRDLFKITWPKNGRSQIYPNFICFQGSSALAKTFLVKEGSAESLWGLGGHR